MLKTLLWASLLAALVTLIIYPAAPVQAAPLPDDQVHLRDDVTLQPEEKVDGDLVVLGGNLSLLRGSLVTGNAVCFGGQVDVQGTIQGDLVAFGGDIVLGETAVVRGDVVSLGGELVRAPGAQTGETISGPQLFEESFWDFRLRGPFWGSWNLFSLLASLGGAFFMGVIGLAIAALWPSQTANVGRTIVQAPGTSLGVGCLLFPLTISLAIFALITICLSPLVPVLALLLIAATLFGWVSLGVLLGRYLARAMGWPATPALLGGVGVLTLTIVAGVIGLIPCLGGLIELGAAGLGLGAVALSRFGTRPYRQRTRSSELLPPETRA